jgi:calcium-dependent protein kinase
MSELLVSSSDFISEHKGSLREAYRFGPILGQSSFGSLRQITHRITSEHRVLKSIQKSSQDTHDRSEFLHEVQVLKSLDHPNIQRIYEFYEDDDNYYLILEYCSGGELFDRISSLGYFSEELAARIIAQILSAITYCHDRNIVHCDLKPENILFENNSEYSNIKVIDFETSQYLNKSKGLRKMAGSRYYIAPEVLKRKYDEKCDVWSIGVMLYIMLCGYPPFQGRTHDEVIKNVLIGKHSYYSPEWDSISHRAKNLIDRMLTYDPSKRIPARHALKHAWLNPANTAQELQFDRVLSNLRAFSCERQLQKAVLTYITTQLCTAQEKEDMRNLFRKFDIDHNGTLTREELLTGFKLIYSESDSDIEAHVDRMMQEADLDGSGRIDYTEFIIAASHKRNLLSRERLQVAFATFDKDNSGLITASELRLILGNKRNYDVRIWDEILREVDSNGDGVIDIREFCDMMLRLDI